jgi:hypothetical protein
LNDRFLGLSGYKACIKQKADYGRGNLCTDERAKADRTGFLTPAIICSLFDIREQICSNTAGKPNGFYVSANLKASGFSTGR